MVKYVEEFIFLTFTRLCFARDWRTRIFLHSKYKFSAFYLKLNWINTYTILIFIHNDSIFLNEEIQQLFIFIYPKYSLKNRRINIITILNFLIFELLNNLPFCVGLFKWIFFFFFLCCSILFNFLLFFPKWSFYYLKSKRFSQISYFGNNTCHWRDFANPIASSALFSSNSAPKLKLTYLVKNYFTLGDRLDAESSNWGGIHKESHLKMISLKF